MEPIAAIIFLGIPAAAVVAGLFEVAGLLLRKSSSTLPAPHYIASRMTFEPDDAAEAKWLKELESLQLPYRHTVC